MEELDDLKNIWKNKPFPPKHGSEISAMLKGTSNSIIAKIKRNIWFELILTIVAGIALLFHIVTSHDSYLRWILVSYIAVFLVYIIYYVKKINLLNRFEGSHGNIKTNLNNLVNDLDAYVRFYKKSYTYLYPVYFLLVLGFIASDRGMNEFIESLKHIETILVILATLIFTLVGSLWFTNWYLKKMYGNHLEKLRELSKEIDEMKPDQAE